MRIAICQMNAGDDVGKNLRVAGELVDDAAASGADLAALPEVFTYLGPSSRHPDVAEDVPRGPACEMLSERARAHGMWVLGGSLYEAFEGRIYTTSPLFDRSGELAARYRKIHRFDVDLPGQPPIRESATFAAGHELVTAETEFCRVGLTICYDVRFPELYRGLMVQGAEVVFVPAAFTYHTGRDHWEVLLRARAVENQCFVVAPAQWGTWGPPEQNRRCYGHSMAVDPWGRVVAEAAEEGTGVTMAELDLDEVRKVREQLPALQHRRLGPSC